MGACGSTNKSGASIIEENTDEINFEKARDEIRDKRDDNIYEVKAKLYEFTQMNNKLIKKRLISKYLFFTPNGKFTSSVSKTMFSDLLIEGFINIKKMKITLITKQQLLENNSFKIKTYEGILEFNNSHCKASGHVTEDGAHGKTVLDKTTFELDFTTELWKGSYMDKANKSVNITGFIRYYDMFYTGIAISEKGFSLIRGMDKNNKCNLIQVYVDPDDNREKQFYNIVGIKDTIANKFDGVIKNRDLEQDTKILFTLSGIKDDE